MQKRQGIAAALGEVEGSPEIADALVGAAEVGEVPAQVQEHAKLHRVRADGTCQRERLLTDRERLVEAPGEHQSVRERRQSLRPLGGWAAGPARARPPAQTRRGRRRSSRFRGGSDRDGRRGALRAASRSRSTRSIAFCASSTARGPAPVRLASSAVQAQRLGEVEPGEPGRVRHRVPERERPLQVGVSLCEAEDRLGLPRGLDRRDERLRQATCRRPVGRQLRRSRRSGCARAPRRGARAAPRARRAGRWRRWPPPAARGGTGSCWSPARRRGRRLPRPRGASRAGRRRAAPRSRAAAGTRLRVRLPRPAAARSAWGDRGGRRARSSRSRSATREPSRCPSDAARSSSAKNGLPSERATIASASAAGRR